MKHHSLAFTLPVSSGNTPSIYVRIRCMKNLWIALVLGCLYFHSEPLQAYDGLDLYSCRISAQDRVNSRGDRLTTLRDMLSQDRANYHKFGKRDQVDESDTSFTTTASRRLFQSAKIRISDSLMRRILAGENINLSVFLLEKNLIDVQEGLLDPNVG